MLSDIVYPDNDDRPMRFVRPGHGVPPVPKQTDVMESEHEAS
jgi:hypothetical protein